MKVRIHKSNIIIGILFLFSPFMSLPLVLQGIHRRSGFSLFMFVCFISFLSYLYIPTIGNDRVFYFEIHSFAQDSSWAEILIMLTNHSDFILQLLVSLFAKLNLSFKALAATHCFISFGIPLYVFHNTFKKSSHYFLFFSLFALSLNLLALFSGMRFYMAASFVILAYYKTFYLNCKGQGIALLILAGLTHFSCLVFIIPYTLLLLFKDRYKTFQVLFVLSFLFIAIPKEVTLNLLSHLTFLGENIGTKLDIYLGSGDDFLERGMAESESSIIVYWGGMLWLYVAYIYLFLTLKIKNLLRSIIYCSFAIVNLFFQATTVFERYTIVLQLLFVFLLIYESTKLHRTKIIYLFLPLFAIKFIFHIIIMRYNIEASYLNTDTFLFFNAIFKQITPADFL